ncbi:MAG: dihydroxyacetone kinase phosphoryl donor subunit DhaM [Chloroflexota bacterium]
MVSLLIVSHSSKLAAGVKEFAEQVSGGKIKIATAGGADDGSLGTSVDRIKENLKNIATPEGILVLIDIGGAALSVETAIEVVDLGKTRVEISDAPLVEGTYLAAIEASAGSTLDQTAKAALEGRKMIKVHRQKDQD